MKELVSPKLLTTKWLVLGRGQVNTTYPTTTQINFFLSTSLLPFKCLAFPFNLIFIWLHYQPYLKIILQLIEANAEKEHCFCQPIIACIQPKECSNDNIVSQKRVIKGTSIRCWRCIWYHISFNLRSTGKHTEKRVHPSKLFFISVNNGDWKWAHNWSLLGFYFLKETTQNEIYSIKLHENMK